MSEGEALGRGILSEKRETVGIRESVGEGEQLDKGKH